MNLKHFLYRLVRYLSTWAWRPVVWTASTIYEVHYEHTSRTLGGDVCRTRILSRWTTQEAAEEAVRKAWREYGWTPVKPKMDGTRTWIESHEVYCPAAPLTPLPQGRASSPDPWLANKHGTARGGQCKSPAGFP